MSYVLDRPGLMPKGAIAWWPVLLGLLVLYVPTYLDLARTAWTTEDQAHGPLVLAIVAWLTWQARSIFAATDLRPAPVLGGILLVIGLLLFVLGRSQQMGFVEIVSQFPVLVGVVLVLGGYKALRALWFPIFFLSFLVPLPGFFVDAITGSLKNYVSRLAEIALYTIGYPIARNGVVLTIGPYQLLVADACSGLHSIYSLGAVGVLYVYLMKHPSWLRNAILIASMLPIAFIANVLRVLVLVLVTYHLGDEAGQGFLHGLAGMILFVIALVMVFALDAFLGLFFGKTFNRSPAAT